MTERRRQQSKHSSGAGHSSGCSQKCLLCPPHLLPCAQSAGQEARTESKQSRACPELAGRSGQALSKACSGVGRFNLSYLGSRSNYCSQPVELRGGLTAIKMQIQIPGRKGKEQTQAGVALAQSLTSSWEGSQMT